MTQVQEGFIVDEDEEVEDRSQRRQEKKKRRREEREREEEHLDEEDLELIGEHNPSLQPPVAAEVCRELGPHSPGCAQRRQTHQNAGTNPGSTTRYSPNSSA